MGIVICYKDHVKVFLEYEDSGQISFKFKIMIKKRYNTSYIK